MELCNAMNTTTPDWWPLERSMRAAGLPIETCGAWMWMYQDARGHAYKHRDSRKYIIIDGLRIHSGASVTDAEHGRELLQTGEYHAV